MRTIVRRAREIVIGLRLNWPSVRVSWPTLSSDRLLSLPEFRLNIMRSTSSFTARLLEVAGNVEAMLEALLSDELRPGEIARPPRLMAALRHAALGGGKRLRPFLTVETARLLDADTAVALRTGCAVELLHCYSLVHDDLPSMDDDDLRRGRPTVHKAFDDATAILTGDALQALAFEVLADPATDPDPAIRAELVLRLARASGIGGMVGGQMLDLAAEGRYGQVTADQNGVRRLQAMKTGAILAFSIEAGAVIARANAADLEALGIYGKALGAAFQIADDILDREASAEAMGKRTGKDQQKGKATLVDLLGMAEARRECARLVEEADSAVARFGATADTLRQAVRFVVEREV
jgi:farnesyl diphosphate synthase